MSWFLFSALFLALGFLFPGEVLGLLLTCIFGFCFVHSVRKNTNKLGRALFLFGIVLHLIAFYWLPETLSLFGGFSKVVSFVLFFVFACVSSLQFVFFGWIFLRLRNTGKGLSRFAKDNNLDIAFCWVFSEFLIPRVFPWVLAHPFISWKGFSGLAEFVGVYPLSGLLLWWSSILYDAFILKRSNYKASNFSIGNILALLLAMFVLFNEFRLSNFATFNQAPHIKVGLVQGNLDVEEKNNLRLLNANLGVYQELSKEALSLGARVLFWPESVMNTWTPEFANNIRGTKLDPFPELNIPLIYGGLGVRKEQSKDRYEHFNAAFVLSAYGEILGRYYKRVLMPFGEYLPFESLFPWLRNFSPHSGDFTSGDISEPIRLKFTSVDGKIEEVSLAILICYEDLVSHLVLDASEKEAQVLVNLTNDAWYGDTLAPLQHHSLASWRAIETRKYLLRVTNTGLTAVVDPMGRTISKLPVFSSGFLVEDIGLSKYKTLYVVIGDVFTWIMIFLVICILLESILGLSKQKSS